MKFRILLFVLGAMLFVAPGVANAAMFGKDESIHFIQDVDVTSQANEPLFLGHKTTTMYVLAGLYITDDGYVFGLRSDHSKYIETTPEEIRKFQEQGLLPNPLPAYSIGIIDYLLGYSLWIAVVIIAIVYLVGWMRKKKTPADTGATPPAPAA